MFDSLPDYLSRPLSVRNVVLCELDFRIANIRALEGLDPMLDRVLDELVRCRDNIEDIGYAPH